MFSSTVVKMSLEASDLQSDEEEECEDLVEDGFSLSADMSEHEKRTRTKRCLRKPPPSSPRSPYLSSLNMKPRRAAVPAWKPVRSPLVVASSRAERGDSLGETATARFTSHSNGHGLLQTVRSECDVTPEFLRQATKRSTLSHSASNGYSLDHREKEDMYDEIIHLKKSLQAQKADNQQMKAKLRRLEEDKNKREKQIEELLDPTKGSEYTRSLVDKKNEGSVVLNGLKQRILKLEQQCREKENALSKLQSELRTTNLEEMKITVETYFEEIRRLRMLVEAAEKSSRAESKGSVRQQKALGSMVQRLSEEVKHLQQDNSSLREELDTSCPAGGSKGYREWSKQRLLRRLLEVEKRLEDSRRHAHSAKSSSRLDQAVQTTAQSELLVGETQGVAMATTEAAAPSSAQEEEEACSLRESVSQLERHREELQHTLTNKDEELNRLRTEKEESERETERWKAEQAVERDKERQSHRQELEELRLRIQALEEEKRQAAAPASSSSPTAAEQQTTGQTAGGQTDGGGGGQTDAERKDEEMEEECRDEELRERAARSIQTGWREHRDRDIVKMQSAIRGHLHRHTLLRDLQKDTKASLSQSSGEVTSPAEGEMDAVAVTMIQSVFRGHLARCSVTTQSSRSSMPSSLGGLLPTPAPRRAHSTCTNASTAGQTHPPAPPAPLEPRAGNAMDSDDSDDIIVSPSRPLRAREKLLL